MKNYRAIIDGLVVVLSSPETAEERELGVAIFGEHFGESEGFLIEQESASLISYQNEYGPYDLRILYLLDVTNGDKEQRRVLALDSLDVGKFCANRVQPANAMYQLAVVLRRDFCEKNRIGEGSIMTFYEEQ